jgi:hypothetical protein
MRKHAGSMFLLALGMAGCDTDKVTAVAPNVAALDRKGSASQATVALPIKGHCETTPVAPPIVTFPFLREEDIGTCELSHLGRTVLHAFRVVNLVAGTQVAVITYTAANGDVIRTTAVGASTSTGPTSFRFTGTTTIAGGTGRFANATGEMQAEGVVDLTTNNASIAYDGWISYDASDR